MTHFTVLVLVPGNNPDIEAQVARLMAPYDENSEMFREGSRWDWYQIGGRSTGFLDNYEPSKDPVNLEPCEWCVDESGAPTGVTTEAVAAKYPAYKDSVGKTCIQCNGTRKTVRFTYAEHAGDIMPVERLDITSWPYLPGAIITPDGKWHEQARVGWFGMTIEDENGLGPKGEDLWKAEFVALLEKNKTATAVVVDAHV